MAPKPPPPPPPRPWTDEMEEDCKRILTVGEECISEKELRALILAKGRGVDKDGEQCDLPLTVVQGIYRLQHVMLLFYFL